MGFSMCSQRVNIPFLFVGGYEHVDILSTCHFNLAIFRRLLSLQALSMLSLVMMIRIQIVELATCCGQLVSRASGEPLLECCSCGFSFSGCLLALCFRSCFAYHDTCTPGHQYDNLHDVACIKYIQPACNFISLDSCSFFNFVYFGLHYVDS